MILIIISVILTLITFLTLGVRVENFQFKEYKITKRNFLGLFWILIILFGCFTKIGANTVGIMYNPFKGGIQGTTLKEGYVKKSPLSKIYKISTEVQTFNFEDITVQTNDAQYVNTEIQVQIRIDNTKAFEYFKKYGNKSLKDIKNIISNTTQKELESITTQYNIMEVLGDKRNEIVNKSLELLKKEFINDGILFERIILVDTDAGTEIEKAIQNEAIAKKNVETAKYKKEQAELEGEAKVIQAKKEQEANQLISKTLTDEILKEKFIEKWNGELPKVTSDNNIFDVSSILN